MPDLSVFDNLAVAEQITADERKELLWGTAVGGTLSFTPSANATDRLFNSSYGTIGSGTGNADYTAVENTIESDIGVIESVFLEVRFYGTGVLTNDTMAIQIYDGTSYTTLETFSSGNQPPLAVEIRSYNVTSILNTITKINACQIRFALTKTGGADADYPIDEARLVVNKVPQIPTVSDNITIVENASLSLAINANVFDAIIISEFINQYLNILYIDVLDPFHVLITESVDVVDLTVEVGVVMDSINPIDNVSLFLDNLYISSYDDIPITENVNIIDLEIDIPVLSDDILILENISVIFSPPDVIADDLISITENINIELDHLFLFVIEPFHVLVTEMAEVLDLVIDVGVVMEAIVVVNQVAEVSLDVVNIDSYEDMLVLWDINLYLDILNIDINDPISIIENIIIEGSDVNINTYDDIVISENISESLNVLYVDVYEPFGILITESISVIDAYKEVGVVASVVNISESVSLYPTTLHPFAPDLPTGLQGQHQVDEYIQISLSSNIPIMFDSITISEYTQFHFTHRNISVFDTISILENVSIEMVYLVFVSDDIIITEDVPNPYFNDLGLSGIDVIAITEYQDIRFDIIDLLVFDSISVLDVPIMNDLVIELGVVSDNINTNENVFILFETINLITDDSITIIENITIRLSESIISVFEPISVVEYFSISGIDLAFSVIDYASLIDIIITDGLGGIEVGDDVGVTGALVDYVLVSEFLSITNSILPISVFENISIFEHAQTFDIIIELQINEDVLVVEDHVVYFDNLIINTSDLLAILESLEVNILISIQLSETISIVEFRYFNNPDIPLIPKKIFNVIPRNRSFLVESVR